jgi:hypothetical protein
LDDLRYDNCISIIAAAEAGQLEAVKWLYSTFKFTRQDVVKNNIIDYAFYHPEVARWLMKTLKIKNYVPKPQGPYYMIFSPEATTKNH